MSWSRTAVVVLGSALVAATLTGCWSPAERELHGIRFHSIAGQDADGELLEIEDNPVRWSTEMMNGEYTAAVVPPCGRVDAPVEISSDEMDVHMDRAAIAAVTCAGPAAALDAWVHAFLDDPLAYTWDGDVLTLSNGNGSLTFERVAPTPR